MKQYKRKIQLIGGSTYTISLPKEWVNDYNLKPQQELQLTDSDNGLFISPGETSFECEDLNFSVDDYSNFMDRIVISSYYHGFENINFYSRDELTGEAKKKIRYAISKLPGVEIISEDKKNIHVKVMIKDFNIDIFQIFYRINLLISSSIESLSSKFDWEEIKLNEKEVDRLYNLNKKILTLSISNRSILKTSKIEKPELIPSLLLINKRLENIADNLKKIATFVEKKSIILKETKNILLKISEELEKSILYLIGKKNKVFSKMSEENEKIFYDEMDKIKDTGIKHLVKWIFRYIVDIEEECIDVGFCWKIKN